MSRAMRLCRFVFLLAAAAWASGCAVARSEAAENLAVFQRGRASRSRRRWWRCGPTRSARSPDGPPARGFGGRLTFYDSKADKPVKVDGTLVVYVFDEEGRDPGNAKPDRKYVFSKEDWERHYSKSELGHSYSVWLPWDEVGGPQKEISLIVRFTPSTGPTIVGEQARQVLPGVKAVAKSEGPQPGTARRPARHAGGTGRACLARSGGARPRTAPSSRTPPRRGG